jgi:hypothetical protein
MKQSYNLRLTGQLGYLRWRIYGYYSDCGQQTTYFKALVARTGATPIGTAFNPKVCGVSQAITGGESRCVVVISVGKGASSVGVAVAAYESAMKDVIECRQSKGLTELGGLPPAH